MAFFIKTFCSNRHYTSFSEKAENAENSRRRGKKYRSVQKTYVRTLFTRRQRPSRPLYVFSEKMETAAKESTLNVLSLRRRNETWLW